ncbi:MAG: phospholipase D family protein [Steroidobacteraceae bacterium]
MRNAAAWLLVLLLSGCASLPKVVNKPVTTAIPASPDSTLGKLVADSREGHNLSGARLLTSGEEAFATLITLADHAERSIDIQQYIIEQDDSARAVLRHVRAAAARGVRVRILVDDLNTVGSDRRYLRLDEQPNLQVRLFNPFPAGRLSYMTRFVFSASQIARINHRMHNKLFVVDDAIAVTGGRNIADQYFVRSKQSNFVDLDLIVAGPVVQELSATFDAFWNSRFAYPVASVTSETAEATTAPAGPEPEVLPEAKTMERDLANGKLSLSWSPAAVLADAPTKIDGDRPPEEADPVYDSMADLMGTANEEVTVISPYFVPGRRGVALMRNLIERGVQVRVLTNSLATNDSAIVHIGYSRYRRELLKAGVKLYELRPVLGQRKKRFHPFKSGKASLHAKSIVIDHRTVFIGSMNMDARSARTNSEMGIVLRNPLIAKQVEGLFDDVVSDASFELSLQPKCHCIEWTTDDGGTERTWHRDPQTSFSLRLGLWLLSPFAADGLL